MASTSREIRSRVGADLDGTIAEIGFGSGLVIPFHPAGVHTVRSAEPDSRSGALASECIGAGHAHVDPAG